MPLKGLEKAKKMKQGPETKNVFKLLRSSLTVYEKI